MLDELKQQVEALKALLDDPHPGVSSWCQALHDRWKKIADLYQEN